MRQFDIFPHRVNGQRAASKPTSRPVPRKERAVYAAMPAAHIAPSADCPLCKHLFTYSAHYFPTSPTPCHVFDIFDPCVCMLTFDGFYALFLPSPMFWLEERANKHPDDSRMGCKKTPRRFTKGVQKNTPTIHEGGAKKVTRTWRVTLFIGLCLSRIPSRRFAEI